MSDMPLSLSVGLRRCFGKPELLERLLRLFLDEQHDVPASIATAIREDAVESAIAKAHGLVSRAGAIGAEALSRIASELEDALRDRRTELWPALTAALLDEHARVTRAAADHLGLAR